MREIRCYKVKLLLSKSKSKSIKLNVYVCVINFLKGLENLLYCKLMMIIFSFYQFKELKMIFSSLSKNTIHDMISLTKCILRNIN